jgi:AcrR family transcriptional regulator
MNQLSRQPEISAPTDARRVRSRKALNRALLSLLEEKGFDQLTIREITARARTGYATFFRHYPTKEALLNDVASDQIAELLRLSVTILRDADSYQSTLALCRYVDEHRPLWSALMTGGAAGIVREEFISQAHGLLPVHGRATWLPADLGVRIGTGSSFDTLAWWLAQPEPLAVEQVSRILHRLVIAPLMGDHLEQE